MDIKIKVSIKDASPQVLGGALRAAFTAATARGAVISMSSGEEDPAPETTPEPVATPSPEPEPEPANDGFTDGDGAGQSFSPDAAPAPALTTDDLMKAGIEFSRAHADGRKIISGILKDYGVRKLTDTPADQIQAVYDRITNYTEEAAQA